MHNRFNLNFILLFVLLLSATVFAQSGRIKPSETPTPTPQRPRIIYTPLPANYPTAAPNPKPTPPKKAVDDGDEVIAINSTLVPIPASVIDAVGRPVTNLKLEDFELSVNGEPAEIADIFRAESPIRLAMLFDNSSSVSIAREFEKKAAIRFFKRVIRPDKDLAALFSVATGTRLEQTLTKNSEQIIQAIENFPQPEGATALLDAIIKAADYLKEVNGRRVIIIVSDGDDTISDSTFEETVRAVQAANCQVYVVKTTDFENFKRTGIRGGNANIRALSAERRMTELALQTGGTVYSPIDEKELDRSFNQISAELSQTYILNYYPDELPKSNEFRNIALKVKGRDDLIIRTRKGYYISKR